MSQDETGHSSDTAALFRSASRRIWQQARDLAHTIDELRENLPGPAAREARPFRSPVPVVTTERGEPWSPAHTAAVAAGIAAGIAAVGIVVALSIRRRRE